MPTKTTFYIGMNDQNMENQIVHPEELLEYAKEEFEGFTAFEAKGGWQGDMENTLVLEVLYLDEDRAEMVKEDLEDRFQQESVMTTREQVEVL